VMMATALIPNTGVMEKMIVLIDPMSEGAVSLDLRFMRSQSRVSFLKINPLRKTKTVYYT